MSIESRASGLDRLWSFNVQRQIATGLGWLGIGLGLLELAGPRTLSRLAGIERPRSRWASRLLGRSSSSRAIALTVRGLGVRELVSGVGLLTQPRPAAWLWSRVAGDLLDLSLLGLALSSRRGNRLRLSGATAAVLGITALDVLCSLEFTRVRRRTRRSWSLIGRDGRPAGNPSKSAERSAALKRPPRGASPLH